MVTELSTAGSATSTSPTTLDRNIEVDLAEVTINYQNLNSVADYIIKTPDCV